MNNELENKQENLSNSEVCDFYLEQLRLLIQNFKEKITNPEQIRFKIFVLKSQVNSLENKLTIELKRRGFDELTDLENYKKWCKVDDVRATLESFKEFPKPENAIQEVDRILGK